MGMAAILINGTWPIEQIFNPPLSDAFKWNLKKTGPGVSDEKSFNGVYGQTDDDGRQVITTAHPEPSAQVS